MELSAVNRLYLLSRGITELPPPPPRKEAPEAKEKAQQQAAERKAPIVKDHNSAKFGDLQMIQSAYKSGRAWVELSEMGSKKLGEEVWTRARVHTVRGKGKVAFAVLRRGAVTVQAIAFANDEADKEMVKFISKINSESVVDVLAKVTKPQAPIESTTFPNVELAIQKIFVVSSAAPVLPFQLEDAAKAEPTEEELAKDDKVIRVSQKVRLDNRVLDLRVAANNAIFRIESAVGHFYRNFFFNNGFIEIHSPKITPGVSEGGAQVFRLNYFGQKACLAQSPQLYKQMAVMGDFVKVFEVGHVFRAENSFTHRHLCEFMGLDFEMEIKEHYHELLKVLSDLFIYIFENVNKTCAAELAAVNKQYPFEPLKFGKEAKVISHTEAVKLLREAKVEIGDLDDFTTPQEKQLGRIVREKFGTDFYIVDKYPMTARPFYTMPCPESKDHTNSYDVFLRGEEITSGAQRVHDVELLKKRATECNIPLSTLRTYLDSFRFGAYPHGGAGIGLERVVMLFLGLPNIRKSSLFPRDPTRLEP